jgi:ElaB/YqjD/DUF883 family membrane-anchored ribosome-binding protein
MDMRDKRPQGDARRKVEDVQKDLAAEASFAAAALRGAGDAAMEKASDLASEAKESALRRGGDLQRQFSNSLRTYAEAVGKACDQLESSSSDTAARLVREAADGLRRCSDSLANKPFEDVLEDVRSYGRQYPAALIGGSVLVGLMLGRLSRSTGTTSPRDTSATPFDPGRIEE